MYNCLIIIVLLLGFISCTQSNSTEAASNSMDAATLQTQSDGSTRSSAALDLDKIPVSKTDLGSFPYLTAPTGYQYADDIKKQVEEKYFFYNDSLIRKVSGTYFHTTVRANGDGFEDTFVVSEYKKTIEKLGGVEIYSGGLPSKASDLIDKEHPAYVADMYDPRPYRYKQFLIRTADANIWIELCHGLNAPQIDLTVVKETSP